MEDEYEEKYIVNMYETPVFFDLVPNKTVEKQGNKSVIVRTSGSDKRHVTVMLAVSASGKVLPMILQLSFLLAWHHLSRSCCDTIHGPEDYIQQYVYSHCLATRSPFSSLYLCIFTARCYAERGIAMASCLSVRNVEVL